MDLVVDFCHIDLTNHSTLTALLVLLIGTLLIAAARALALVSVTGIGAGGGGYNGGGGWGEGGGSSGHHCGFGYALVLLPPDDGCYPASLTVDVPLLVTMDNNDVRET